MIIFTKFFFQSLNTVRSHSLSFVENISFEDKRKPDCDRVLNRADLISIPSPYESMRLENTAIITLVTYRISSETQTPLPER